MSFYNDAVLPHVLDLVCSQKPIMELRQKIVPLARGRVLEVGIGSGINLPLYDASRVEFVWGLEPSQAMRKKAAGNLRKSPVEVRWLDLPGEQIPLDDASVDTVLLTYTLCTIPDWALALEQMRRVLKPGGVLLFCEHGRSPDAAVRKWQDRITPFWKPMVGGCHLNRPVREYLEQGGFSIQSIDSVYVDRMPHFVGYMSYGQAIKDGQP